MINAAKAEAQEAGANKYANFKRDYKIAFKYNTVCKLKVDYEK